LWGGHQLEATGDLADLTTEIVPLLRQLPGVERIEASSCFRQLFDASV